MAKTGRRFRDTVLSEGGSRHPMEVYRDFRGREPSTERAPAPQWIDQLRGLINAG